MARPRKDTALAADLQALLAPSFAGMTVEVAHSTRWNRMCVTFRWSGFKGLLPEERFHRLVAVIPEEVRESRLEGLVWLELEPKESIEAYLERPRSEDVVDREATIHAALVKAGFFDALAASLRPTPTKTCGGDFSRVEAVLLAKRWTPSKVRDAKLVFIRHGAYCDCQVLQAVQPELARVYADAG